MTHAFQEDPDAPGWCRRCPLPRANKRHQGGEAVPLAGVAWPPADPTAPQRSEFERIADGIRTAAGIYPEFSANEARELTEGPITNTKLYGAVYASLTRGKEIKPTGKWVPSTDPATHGHRIGVYRRGPCLQRPRVAA